MESGKEWRQQHLPGALFTNRDSSDMLSTESKPPKQRKKRLVLVGIDTRSAVFQSRCTNAFFPIDTSVGIFLSIVQVSFIEIPSYRRCFLDGTIEFADG